MRINEAFNAIRSAIIEWNGFLINDHSTKVGNEITWQNREQIDASYPITTTYISKLLEKKQYSVQVRDDGSLFQIYYQYDRSRHNIIKSSLSFYFLGNVVEQVQPDEYETISYIPNADVGWFRIDYDCEPTHDRGVTHASNHMHISLFPETRLMVNRNLNPKQFVEFVIAACYPSVYQHKRLDAAGRFNDYGHICTLNTPSIPNTTTDNLHEFVAHLCIPVRTTIDIPNQGAGRR